MTGGKFSSFKALMSLRKRDIGNNNKTNDLCHSFCKLVFLLNVTVNKNALDVT